MESPFRGMNIYQLRVLDAEGFVQSKLDQNLAPERAHCHLAFLLSSRERQVRLHAIYKAQEAFTFVRLLLFSITSAKSMGDRIFTQSS